MDNTAYAYLLAGLFLAIGLLVAYGALSPARRERLDTAVLNLVGLAVAALAASLTPVRPAPAEEPYLAQHRATPAERWVALGPWPRRLTPADDHDSTWS